jgi:hypothetical protein
MGGSSTLVSCFTAILPQDEFLRPGGQATPDGAIANDQLSPKGREIVPEDAAVAEDVIEALLNHPGLTADLTSSLFV